MAYDPCNPVPSNTIPTGLPLHPHHAAHHVVGRIRHRIHHKFVHMGPPAAAPNPYGCEKHAIAGPGYGRGLPASPIAPLAKLPVVAGAGLAALGGGVLVGTGIIPISSITTTPHNKVSITPPGTTPVSTNPVPGGPVPPSPPSPPTTPVVPPGGTVPGTPPTLVPEPSTLVVFLFAVAVAMAARQFHHRRLARVTASSG